MRQLRVTVGRIALVTFGSVLALLVAILLFAIKVPTSAQLAYAIGCLGTVITLQLDAIVRAIQGSDSGEVVSDAVNTLIRSPLSDLFLAVTATALSGQSRTHPVFQELARRRLVECSERVRSLSQGEVLLPNRDPQFLTGQVARARQEIRALSYLNVDIDWWLSKTGSDYIQENIRAARRGVSVRRIFICNDLTKDLQHVANQYLLGGIEVLQVSVRDLPPTLHRNLLVIDRSFLFEHRANISGDTVGYLYASDPMPISEAIAAFDLIAGRSRPVLIPSLGTSVT